MTAPTPRVVVRRRGDGHQYYKGGDCWTTTNIDEAHRFCEKENPHVTAEYLNDLRHAHARDAAWMVKSLPDAMMADGEL